ncbi:MAG: hypothetical protein GX594_15155 [Pirellulaceae bacterium]|nr:hypothetical protein [Pirellulaceae bacterium]
MQATNQETVVGESMGGTLRFTHLTTRPQFARRISQPPKLLDLLDIIAGGNGSGRQRERGLDPTTGMEDPIFVLGERIGDGKYHPVSWHRLIDGVFIPGKGPVQIDSAGGAFDGFRATSDSTWGSIWPRAAEIDSAYERRGWIYEIERSEQFMPERLGMIGVCPNVGWTFDLAAVREMYKSVRPDRLRTIAGLGNRVDFADPFDGKIDLWVIVDGEARFNRLGMMRKDGAIEIDVKLKTTDRFLTLAVTDGGDGQAGDWVIFGDPVIQTKHIEENP